MGGRDGKDVWCFFVDTQLVVNDTSGSVAGFWCKLDGVKWLFLVVIHPKEAPDKYFSG